VRVVEARPGGQFLVVEQFTVGSRYDAVRVALERQEDIDRYCYPRRCYVVDGDGVPIVAAGMCDRMRALLEAHASMREEKRKIL
jgi:hypothetical protein